MTTLIVLAFLNVGLCILNALLYASGNGLASLAAAIFCGFAAIFCSVAAGAVS